MDDEVILSAVRSVPAALIRSGVQRVFNNRLRRAKGHVNHVILVSPWISAFEGDPHSVEQLVRHIDLYRIRTYIFTRPPATSLENAVISQLALCHSAEIVVNPHLHAKVYACVGPSPYGFGIVSSANFTDTSSQLYEIGMLIVGMGAGAQIVDQLSDFALSYLRTRPESRVLKRIDLRRNTNGVGNSHTFMTELLSYLVDQSKAQHIIDTEGLQVSADTFPFETDALDKLSTHIASNPEKALPSAIISWMSNAAIEGWRARYNSATHQLVSGDLVEQVLFPEG